MECALLIFKEEIHWIGSQKCIELLGYPKKTFSFFCFFHWYESNLGEYKVKKLLSEFQFSTIHLWLLSMPLYLTKSIIILFWLLYTHYLSLVLWLPIPHYSIFLLKWFQHFRQHISIIYTCMHISNHSRYFTTNQLQ
jgi:hypothetical protein